MNAGRPVGEHRARPDASYSTVGVGDQLSFRLIQDNQVVAKRVAYSGAQRPIAMSNGARIDSPRPSKRLRKPR